MQDCARRRSRCRSLKAQGGEELQQQWSTLVRAVDGVQDNEELKDAAVCLWTAGQRAPHRGGH